MKVDSNTYDIDGELIRQSGDTHKMTLQEAKEQIEKYRQKLEKLDEKDPKATVYATYMRNLTNYIMSLYSKMSSEELQAEMGKMAQQKTTEEQVKQAIEELKQSLDDDGTAESSTENEVSGPIAGDSTSSANGELGDDTIDKQSVSSIHEERPTTQGDLLVERADVNTTMDEYVNYEEIS